MVPKIQKNTQQYLFTYIPIKFLKEKKNYDRMPTVCRCQSEAGTEEFEQSTFNLYASRTIMAFMLLGIAFIYFLHPYFAEYRWLEPLSIVLISSILDIVIPLLFLLYNRNVRMFILHNLKRLLCFTDNIVDVME
jgi:hypothetical protein